MFNPLSREVPLCPECRRPVGIVRGRCWCCGAKVYVPLAYFRLLWVLVLITLAGLGSLTFNARHAGTWLLVLLFTSIPIRLIWGALIPPWTERGSYKGDLPLIPYYIAISVFQIGYWTLWGWLHLGLGASKQELSDNWDMYSVPLAWINPSFLIRPDKWLSDVFGTIAGNSLFYTIIFLSLYKVVRTRLNRNRAIQLDLGKAEPGDEQ